MRSRLIPISTTSKMRNVSALFCCLVTFSHSNATSIPLLDARDIMKRSLEAGDRNAMRIHEYASSKRVDEKQLDIDGSVRSETVKSYDDVVIESVLIRKLIAKDGKPLPPAEARKEEERVNRIATARAHETYSEKEKRLAEKEKKHIKALAFSREIYNAFDFRLIGEEQIDGRKNWIIEATPTPGYQPKELRARVLPHLKGKVWIDEQDLLWTKADATAVDPFAPGFGMIAKLDQGAHLYFDQIRSSDGVWLLRESGLRAVLHIAVIKRIGIEQVSTFDNFRKVPSGVDVVEDSTGK